MPTTSAFGRTLEFRTVLFNAFYLVVTVVDDVNNFIAGKTAMMNSVSGIILTALGIPLYYYFRKRKRDALR